MPRSFRVVRLVDTNDVRPPYRPIPEHQEVSQYVQTLQRHLSRIDVRQDPSSEPLYLALGEAISATIIYFNAGEVCPTASREYPGLLRSVCIALAHYLSRSPADRSGDSLDITLRAVRCYADLAQRASHQRVGYDDRKMETVLRPLARALGAVHAHV